jgi:hypothetical protein
MFRPFSIGCGKVFIFPVARIDDPNIQAGISRSTQDGRRLTPCQDNDSADGCRSSGQATRMGNGVRSNGGVPGSSMLTSRQQIVANNLHKFKQVGYDIDTAGPMPDNCSHCFSMKCLLTFG